MPEAALSIYNSPSDQLETPDVWLSVKDSAELLNISPRMILINRADGKYVSKQEQGNGGSTFKILLSSLPASAKIKYYDQNENKAAIREIDDVSVYNSAKEFNRKKADKYAAAMTFCEGFKGQLLRDRIAEWNLLHPEHTTSYTSICNIRSGRISPVGAWGNREGDTKIRDDFMEYFKAEFLKEGGPSIHRAWLQTVGFAKRLSPDFNINDFPSDASFRRRLEREVPKNIRYLKRHGPKAYNKKFGTFINRDYSDVKCGEVWVGDHAQIDVMVIFSDGRIGFPWLTSWCDFKSGKMLGWMLHDDDPNSDHIFMTFHYAASAFGLCKDVIIDNGKDYKAKDFAGGRKVKVSFDEIKVTSMLSRIGVTPHFCIPYNAQAKIIERQHLKIKNWLSKGMVGYRGGNVVERPEKLKREIKDGDLMKFSEFSGIFDDFIENVLNKNVSEGKNLLGKSPDMLWAEEFTEKREVSPEALDLFCMRTTNTVQIGRNGVPDSKLGVYYWGEWMAACKGRKVYVRRNLRDYATGIIYDAVTDELLGKARVGVFDSPALAKTEVDKHTFDQAMAAKRRAERIERDYAKLQLKPVHAMQFMADAKAGVREEAGGDVEETEPKIHAIANSKMDADVKKLHEMAEPKGSDEDLSIYDTPQNFSGRKTYDEWDDDGGLISKAG